MVSLKDIAKQCGVSVASVSKAINHMPGVGPQTAQRIRDMARKMGYLPNAAAQALKTNRSFNIGVLLEDDDRHGLLHHFFVSVLEHFKMAMEEMGYDLMLMNRTIGRRTVSYLEHCRHSNLDGVFVACVDFFHPELQELAAAGIPLVSIDHTYKGHPSVYSDNVEGIRKAVKYAHKLGHRRIAYISGAPAGVTARREEGFRMAMAQLGLEVPKEYRVFSRYRDIKLTQKATARLLALPTPPTCILMPDDYASLGGIKAIREAGLRIPEDISIIGFDGLPTFEHAHPRICTVYQDVKTIGTEAARLLLQRIENKAQPFEESPVIVPVRLVKGDTVTQIAES